MRPGYWLCGLVMTLTSVSLCAEEAYPYLYGLFTISEPDRGRGRDVDEDGFAVGFGYPMAAENFTIEGTYFDNTMETGENSGSDYYQRGLGLDVAYSFGDRDRFTPFVLIGLGGVENDVVPDSLDDTGMYGNLGAGFVGRLFNSRWLRYRGEVRYFKDDFRDGMEDVRFGLGIEVALGQPSSAPAAEPKTVEKVVYQTRTVEVPPKDSDGDGIVDTYDQCPGTYAGAKVDGRGCVIQQQTINIENITFASNSAELSVNAKYTLASALEFLRNQPNLDVEIAGHTDDVGAASYNQTLSQKRAESVRNYFAANGVAASRLSARGYGESSPVASNTTAEGRNRNRRVEMRLIPR